ncbi:MAG: kojibiose phosphorylase [Pseudonocardiales bacterium]|nr:kojibiose phosphorylase [Pseudonocardiales bacterium]
MNDAAWVVEQSGFDVARANFYETLFTVGNGRLGTRGSLEEGHLGQLSGTFLGGVYDGHEVPVIDLVNAPDWLDTAVFVDGVRLDVDTCTVVSHERRLDLRDGILTRTTVFADPDGRRTRLHTVRCASMADRRLCALRVEVTPENHESDIVVETGIDGDRRNLERLPVYPHDHVFDPRTRWEKWARAKHTEETSRSADDGLYLQVHTIDTGVEVGYRAETTFTPAADERTVQQRSERIGQRTVHHCAAGETLRMDKLVAICTSRDPGGSGPLDERCRAVLAAHRDEGFDGIVAASRAAWTGLWEACDCEVVGDERFTRALRFGVYHLLITANPDDPTVNIGAKSLSGEGYRGHVFWDTEIFMLPFFILTQPDTANALLRYRHHTLDGARANSREYGTGGARFAWESADTGREECPQFTVDGANRFWTREEEIHVSADVAYGIFRYVEATGDTAFLREVGAEVLFETSRFWVDRATPTTDGAGYELTQVMGPDEFHSHTDNNAFTNRLAQWHLRYAVSLYDELRDSGELETVAAAIGLEPQERDRWARVADGLVGPRVVDGVIEQFTGYFERDDVPVTEWDENDMPRYPKGYHHFNCESTQLLKQPDVVMLTYLFPDEFSVEDKRANFEYYEARTLHKSSLSPSIHAIIGIEVGDTTRAVQYFERSVLVDLTDNQGNTAEGMHIASAAGTWQILVNGFGGLRILHGKVTFKPWLPPEWQGIRFRIRWRGRPIHVAIDHDHVELLLGGPAGGTEEVVVGDETVALKAGEPVRVARPRSS